MLILNPSNRDALKNIFVRENSIVTIYNISCRHRDSFSTGYLKHIKSFDVNGYTMSYQLQPKVYVWIDVDIDNFRKTTFVAEVASFKDYLLQDLFYSEVLIKYNSSDGIPVW